MKTIKSTLWVVCVLSITSLSAQKTEKIEKEPKHEISLDLFELATISKFEFSYSYLLNDSNSIGLTLSHAKKNENSLGSDGFLDNYSANLNFKHFFSNKHTQGFYIEFFGRYSNGDAPIHESDVYQHSIEQNSIYLGLGIGYKYITKSNFFIDANIGFAKKVHSFNNSIPNYSKPNIYTHLGISVGKRF